MVIKFSGWISTKDYPKIEDKLFDYTQTINVFINENHKFAKAWLIAANFFLDGLFATVCISFILESRSYRILFSVGIFYLVRGVLQQFQTLPFPEGQYWEYPGFPSLINIYGRQSDFFYSGHIGFCLLCTIELFNNKSIKWGILGICVTVFMGFTLVSFREHYTIDLFTGLIMGHYCYYVTGFFIHYWDQYLVIKGEFSDEVDRSKSSSSIL